MRSRSRRFPALPELHQIFAIEVIRITCGIERSNTTIRPPLEGRPFENARTATNQVARTTTNARMTWNFFGSASTSILFINRMLRPVR